MHGQMGDMMGEGLLFGACLARDGLVGENDVAEEWRPAAGALRSGTTARSSPCRCRANRG